MKINMQKNETDKGASGNISIKGLYINNCWKIKGKYAQQEK